MDDSELETSLEVSTPVELSLVEVLLLLVSAPELLLLDEVVTLPDEPSAAVVPRVSSDFAPQPAIPSNTKSIRDIDMRGR